MGFFLIPVSECWEKSLNIYGGYNCNSSNIVYMLECAKCSMQYVGESQATLNQRFLQHRGYVRNKELDKVTGEHFNKPGHNIADMKICVIEQLKNADPTYRKVRESMHIQNFGATKSLMNKKRWLSLFANCNPKFFCYFLVFLMCLMYGKSYQALLADDEDLNIFEIYPNRDPDRWE